MAKTAYNIQLKGYVGGADFDRNAVDKTLAEYSGKPVNVLIDSLGGSLATGCLSLRPSSSTEMSASTSSASMPLPQPSVLAAQATSSMTLGAAHISIDAGAMYFVRNALCAFKYLRTCDSEDGEKKKTAIG